MIRFTFYKIILEDAKNSTYYISYSYVTIQQILTENLSDGTLPWGYIFNKKWLRFQESDP